MKMVEITNRAIMNELEKLNARLERAEKTLEKKRAAAEKLGVANWTNEDHAEYMKTVPVDENGWILDKVAIKKRGAWFDLSCAEEDVKEAKERIENAERRLEKSDAAVEEYRKEVEAIEDLKRKEELFKKNFEQEQKEWAKDGITLTARYTGITPNGKRFCIEGNNGFTNRSRHCFTLYIDGKTIFTSGEFWRAYGVIKRS